MGGKYRGVNKGVHVLISRIQAGPGRTVKQEQEEISRNHVQTFIYLSVHLCGCVAEDGTDADGRTGVASGRPTGPGRQAADPPLFVT